MAAAILEVLAGARPGGAAAALGMSLPRYYQLEGRALRGLLQPASRSREGAAQHAGELAAFRTDQRLQRELARQQALVRLAQRSVGLAPAPPVPAKSTGKSTASEGVGLGTGPERGGPLAARGGRQAGSRSRGRTSRRPRKWREQAVPAVLSSPRGRRCDEGLTIFGSSVMEEDHAWTTAGRTRIRGRPGGLGPGQGTAPR